MCLRFIQKFGKIFQKKICILTVVKKSTFRYPDLFIELLCLNEFRTFSNGIISSYYMGSYECFSKVILVHCHSGHGLIFQYTRAGKTMGSREVTYHWGRVERGC